MSGVSRIVIFVVLALAMALGPVSCTMQDDNVVVLNPGDTFTTQSGLTLTIPQGTSATVSTPKRDEIQPDVPFTEFVEVDIDDSLTVVLMSFSGTRRNNTGATVVATGSDAVVLKPSAESLSLVLETNLQDAAPGRVVIIVPPGSDSDSHGLDLVRSTLNHLSVRGVTLPSGQ